MDHFKIEASQSGFLLNNVLWRGMPQRWEISKTLLDNGRTHTLDDWELIVDIEEPGRWWAPSLP